MMNDILDETSKKIKFGYVFNSNSSLVRKNVINLVKAFDSIKSRNAVLILKYIPLKKSSYHLCKDDLFLEKYLVYLTSFNNNIYLISDIVEI